MTPFETLLFRIFFAVVIGGIIGAEREYRSKSAGLRTMILICVSSLLFTTFSLHISPETPDRIASNIVTGIGFLGAGVIFRSDKGVNGITTAATIWITAALGMGIASGDYLVVLVSTVLVLSLLFLFTRLENWIDQINRSRSYKIVTEYHHDTLKHYERLLHECNLKFRRSKRTRSGTSVTGTWTVRGPEKAHDLFVEKILGDESVKEFEF